MNISEKHAEWISLLDVSGPFLAVSVLEDAFPQGLDKVDTPFRQRLRAAYDEWRDAVDEDDAQLDGIHREWVKLVVQDFLEYDASVLKSGDGIPDTLSHHDTGSDITFRPDYAVMAAEKARLLISVTAPGTRLDDPSGADAWLASPAERLIALCRTTGVRIGLVTNGEQWMVVSVPPEGGSSRASWYARLWFQEPVTLQAFASLLGVRRCFGEETQTLDALVQKSLEHQDEVTDTLGEQVRRAVEVLVQALDRADQDRNRTLLKDVTPAQLFEAGLTVMMRLVVLLCAEERKLLLLGEPVYDQNYAISTLRSQLVEQASHGTEVLERRQDAWSRLLATFRGVFGGIHHETLRLPPLGGSLFDPDRFPFLEGRAPETRWKDTPAVPLPIDNHTVLLLLKSLQVLEHRSGAQLLSYESLDVEQIGHVYEGLLERTVKRVSDVTLSLNAAASVRKKTGYPEISLPELEKQAAASETDFVEYLSEVTGRSKSALRKDLQNPLPPKVSSRLLLACGNDLSLHSRIRAFGNLLRTDSWGDPLVYRENAFIVTHGVGRRETGSHYTPKSLTEPIVQHTLEPLVYVGPAEGHPREEWKLKTPAELLALKVCDLAMGSGAFLVQTCRYLAERLVEAWDIAEQQGNTISIQGAVLSDPSVAEPMPREKAERILNARRLVSSSCLYGVDLNPLAVELAKLSLWLVTMMKGRPFTFLDHALKCGDSLLGVSALPQIENFSLRPGERQLTFATANLFRYVEQAGQKRRELEDLPSNDHTQIETKNRLHAEAEAEAAKVKALADCLIALELRGLNGNAYADARETEADQVQHLLKQDADAALKSPNLNQPSALAAHAKEQLHGRRPFHWPVEFPEVFARGGFDAFIGNPPFLGGKRLSGVWSVPYREFLVRNIAHGVAGNADLCAYFFLRASQQLSATGFLGLIATNTICQGDTADVGLAQLVKSLTIYRAIQSCEWPGTAGVYIAEIWATKQDWSGSRWLGERAVKSISEMLTAGIETANVSTLVGNKGKLFLGSNPRGKGFILSTSEATELLRSDAKNREVIFPYLSGEDLNTHPSQVPSRMIINFRDWPRERAERYAKPFARLTELVLPERKKIAHEQSRKKCVATFWRYDALAKELYEQLAQREGLVLAMARVSPTNAVVWVSRDVVFHEKVIVMPGFADAEFSIMQSSIHWEWARNYTSTLGATTLNYSPSDCFETFAFPVATVNLSKLGADYHEFRREIMQTRQEGLTKTYNRFHDRGEASADIARLRALHVEMDQAVTAAYGWRDLDLGHGFHATKQGERYTLSESARRIVLDRLLAFNHQRYEEEVKAGLHAKKKAGTKRKAQAAPASAPDTQELALDFSAPANEVLPKPREPQKPADAPSPGRTAVDIDPTELLNAIFTCAARRESTDRDDLAKEVATALGFQRLRDKTREVIASGFNSAIRRGLITYEGQFIVRLARTYADLEIETLVKAIAATVRPECVYSPEEVIKHAANYLGCLHLDDSFRESLESALTTAIRRGLITKRGE